MDASRLHPKTSLIQCSKPWPYDRFETALDIARRGRLTIFTRGALTAVVLGLCTCGCPSVLRANGAFMWCAGCGRSDGDLWRLLGFVDEGAHDPAGPTTELERVLARVA